MKRDPYWLRVLTGFDHLINAIAGDNPDVTVSARIGKMAATQTPHWTWCLYLKCIDTAFYPIDGKYHCLKAYRRENRQGKYHHPASPCILILFLPLLIIVCILTGSITWTYEAIINVRYYNNKKIK